MSCSKAPSYGELICRFVYVEYLSCFVLPNFRVVKPHHRSNAQKLSHTCRGILLCHCCPKQRYTKSIASLSFPDTILRILALSCLALPCLALPCLALPCLALPCLALPCLALPCLALPHECSSAFAPDSPKLFILWTLFCDALLRFLCWTDLTDLAELP